MADGNSGGASPLIVAIVALLSAAIAGAASFGVGYLTFASKDQELKVHLVEIAIGILRADPKEDVAPARAWAMDVIEQKSGVSFTAEDRAALLHKPLLSTQLAQIGEAIKELAATNKTSDDARAQMLMMMMMMMMNGAGNPKSPQSGKDAPK